MLRLAAVHEMQLTILGNNMYTKRFATIVFGVSLMTSFIQAQSPLVPFRDDFDDPSTASRWTPSETLDGFDIPAPRIENGSLIITPPDEITSPRLGFHETELNYESTATSGPISIRAQVRMSQIGDYWFVMGRETDASSAYVALAEDGSLLFSTVDGTFDMPTQERFWDVETDLDLSTDDIKVQFDILGSELRLWAWNADEPQPSLPQITGVRPDYLDDGEHVYLLNTTSTPSQPTLSVRYFEATHPTYDIGGIGAVDIESFTGNLQFETEPAEGTQSGLLQRWFSISNPRSLERFWDRVYDPEIGNDNQDSDVPAFHSKTTWWTGDRQAIRGLPAYPAEVIDQTRTYEGTTWNSENNEDYSVFLEGQIRIPESGTYRFLDGIDDFAALAIDLNRDGFLDEDETLINDNAYTNLNRDVNDGGIRSSEIPSVDFDEIAEDGEWFDIQAYVAEGFGGDSGVFYWDYDGKDENRDGVRVGDAEGFPTSAQGEGGEIADEHIASLAIGDEFLRSSGGEVIASGTATLELEEFVTYRFELGDGGHDQLSVKMASDVLDRVLDVGASTIEIASIGETLTPGEYRLLDFDAIINTDDATLLLDDELANVLDTSRLFTEGVLVVPSMLSDCNGDNLFAFADVDCISADELTRALNQLGLPLGDADGNGEVDFADFLTLSGNFSQPGVYTAGDFNKNGTVDFGDFLLLSENYGSSTIASVPEPTHALLVTATLGCLMLRRRRLRKVQ